MPHTPADIDGFLDALDAAIAAVSTNRADLGAFQNRLESTIRNLRSPSENLSAAESRIRDTDMAHEMVSFTRSPDPVAGRYRHAGAGQPGPPGRPVPAPLIHPQRVLGWRSVTPGAPPRSVSPERPHA